MLALDVRSAYSLLSSPLDLSDYVSQAKALAYPALGLADRNVMYGAWQFYQLCRQAGIKPLIGMTLVLPSLMAGQAEEEWLVYAKNYQGYQRLMKLSSLMQTEKDLSNRQVYDYLVANQADFLLIMPALEGRHIQLIKAGHANVRAEMKQVITDFEQIYIGLSPLEADNYHLDQVLSIADQLQIPLLALPPIKYLEPHDLASLKVLQAIDKNQPLDQPEILADMSGPYYLWSQTDYEQAYQDLGVSNRLVDSDIILNQLNLDMPKQRLQLPHYPVPDGDNPADYLARLAYQGLAERTDNSQAYQDRLDYELAVIHDMGFDDYFLIVWDVMDYAHRQQIQTGPGRGSAAGALVAYALYITDVDPVANALLFERFLNPERQNMPDIDLDFPDNKRQEIIDYVVRKYGPEHVAQIATFGTFAARRALRDVGSALGRDQQSLSRWSNTVQGDQNVDIKNLFQNSHALQHLVAEDQLGSTWLEIAHKIQGLPRHVSTHAAGIILSDQPLTDNVPLQASNNHVPLSQYTMGDVEAIGLLKIDFLSLINLTILANSLAAASKLAKKKLEPLSFDREDQAVYQVFRDGDTNGVFQFESEGIRQVLKRVAPTSMADVAAVNALYRPGPMQQIDHFVNRKHGREAIAYPHPDLADILAPTYGVMVYQEQVMQVTNRLAGFSLAEADILRRAISKKNEGQLAAMRDKFLNGAQKLGYSQATADQVFQYIEAFANYGFNKSHAYAYSYLAYQLAWLKVYFPAAFYFGNLRSHSLHDSKGKLLVQEAKEHGVTILPPDINLSYYDLTVIDDQTLRLGLSDIKGLNKPLIRDILSSRQHEGSFKNLKDLVTRLNSKYLKEDQLAKLAWANALDCFAMNKRTLIEEAIPKWLTHASLFASPGQQLSLDFGSHNQSFQEQFEPQINQLTEYDSRTLLTGEQETLGQSLTVDLYSDYQYFYQLGILKKIHSLGAQEKVTVLGELVTKKQIKTKKGQQMAFIDLQDDTATIEMVVFPQAFIENASVLLTGDQVMVQGRTQLRQDQLQLVVDQVYSLNDKVKKKLSDQAKKIQAKRQLYIRVSDRQQASQLKPSLLAVLAENPGPNRVSISMEAEQETYRLGSKYSVLANKQVVNQLRTIFGYDNVILS
ncbi:hypothetical protein AWM75_06740 [Aerococcus urinaehominis]|uniref:DNA polymerase III subunit alpha n=1 Tax=Aerococcus urinaehominis TaxID=128944 RepID=A0A0X8FN36_9LACT|nr:DNA polymerase III subunit alpha [Aerococcus urinaehominis]AMB99697.1 hypothetical protein AWM75_06740 [Aerococcus urinaehominis]SDL90960.1 DNA polymerase-3 subunit alpha [Aerococcus urinaehominis]